MSVFADIPQAFRVLPISSEWFFPWIYTFQFRNSFHVSKSSAWMAPRKGTSPFSRVKSPQLDPNKHRFVLSNKVCGKRPPKYFGRKFPARFPEDIVKICKIKMATHTKEKLLRRTRSRPRRLAWLQFFFDMLQIRRFLKRRRLIS